MRHLLAHAGGYGFDGSRPIVAPRRRRIYSNTGIELLAAHVEARAGLPFADLPRRGRARARSACRRPSCRGSPAHQLRSTVTDLAAFAGELLAPTLLAPATLAEATTVQFPGLGGVLPGVGRFQPLDWGLGFELRDAQGAALDGPVATRRPPSATSAAPAPSCGSIRWPAPASSCSPTARSGRGPSRRGRPLSDAVLADLKP